MSEDYWQIFVVILSTAILAIALAFFLIYGFRVPVSIFAGLGAIFLAAGLFFLHKTRTFLATATTVLGRVIAVEHQRFRSHRRNNYSIYTLLIQFELPNGEPVQFQSEGGTKEWRVGQFVEVIYQPDQPRSARIHYFARLWLGAIVLTIIGGAWLLIVGMAQIIPPPSSP